MNKKHKNKNRSKPTNPVSSPQKVESPPAVEEATSVLSELTPESLVKESESCVETVSETTLPGAEECDLADDTPKKPKRNKGKKKKPDELISDENKLLSHDNQAPIPLPAPESETKNESNVKNPEPKIEEEDKQDEESITPNVRKKKNKKKHNEKEMVEEPLKETDVAEKLAEDKINKDELISTELTEPEVKQSKKKNKKKKHRHDSEKSEKGDEVTCCTAAFQKLITSTDNEDEIKPEKLVEISKGKIEEDNLAISLKEETLQDLIESVLLPEEKKQSDNEGMQEKSSNESKIKKRKKKDKKQSQPKEESIPLVTAEQQTPIEPISSITSEGQLQGVTLDDFVQDLQVAQKEDIKFQSMENISKPKAKIAKPVEKNRKVKAEPGENFDKKVSDKISSEQIKETLQEHTSSVISLKDTSPKLIDKVEESIQTKEEKVSDQGLDSKTFTEQVCLESEKPIVSSIQKMKQVVNVDDIKDTNKSLKVGDGKTDIKQTDLLQLVPDVEPQHPTKSSSLFIETDKKYEDIPSSPEPYKTVEKKKKKHPKKIEVAHNIPTDPIPKDKILVTPDSEIAKVEISQKQKEDLILDISIPGDVEISSIKTDEMESSSDATPDFIHHPLATSQQLIDNNNNNMVIREITSTNEKICLPLLIPNEPIIQGSGETPEPALEKISIDSSSNVTIKEKININEPEKTDLKSKMMEVSQDMEELRLSIERSLAELTSMEKSEHDAEQKLDASETPKADNIQGAMTYPEKYKNKSEESKSLIENVQTLSSEIITLGLSEVLNETDKHKSLPATETIQDKILESPTQVKVDDQKPIDVKDIRPAVPVRKDQKGKGKGKKKGKQDTQSHQTTSGSESNTTTVTESTTQEVKKEEKEKAEQKGQSTGSNENKGKQQSLQLENDCHRSEKTPLDSSSSLSDDPFEPIENFEDALTSSVDDVNKTFEMIASEVNNAPEFTFQNPEINIIAPTEGTEPAKSKQNPVSPPKNLLGHPDIPVPSNRTDYKKEKNKPPNMRQAKVKIKDAVDIEPAEKTKQSKESQTENRKKLSNGNVLESFSYMSNQNSEYVYKYSFRKVFLQSLCHVCRKELTQRVPCQFCSLVFYCSQKHKDEDWPQHQALCFAVCTIVHLKDQKHIYAEAKNITGQNYRLLRMQMIISCEKVLKRRLAPWEQEALLYPRLCADVTCREWRQNKLADCEGCAQISYCSERPDHLPGGHRRWCRHYSLYRRLVQHQQTLGRLQPRLPARLVPQGYRMPGDFKAVLGALFDGDVDMSDTEFAALTQLATAPLTASYAHQLAASQHDGLSKKPTFVVHLLGAELQFEADVLFKWELFLLHLLPGVRQLRVGLISPELNPFQLPLDLLGKISMCTKCREEQRRVTFSFQDKKGYYEYWASDDFQTPDIVCALNPGIQRASLHNGKDTWPTAISCILKLKVPFIISAYSINELQRDLLRVKECAELSGLACETVSEPAGNPFASARPDRNFITDDEVPLLFKNYCFAVLCGV